LNSEGICVICDALRTGIKKKAGVEFLLDAGEVMFPGK